LKVQTRRKSTRSKATPVQNVISHDGMDFGKRPCPNLMQIRSSTMHIARESQQKDPTFLKGFLKTIIR
jgi:hypothetical protein